jgi:hypothetical protein
VVVASVGTVDVAKKEMGYEKEFVIGEANLVDGEKVDVPLVSWETVLL